MKWVSLVVGFLVLVTATCWVWNRRFEPQQGRAMVRVGEVAGGGFSVEKQRGDKPFAKVCGLPFGGPVEILHLRMESRSVNLVPDGEKWKDGRLILEWMDPAGGVVARDSVLTLQGSDANSRREEMIVRSVGSGLVPMLRVEHLGASGRMEIHSLQAVAVQERGWLIWVAGGLLASWGLWSYGFARVFTKASRTRVTGVALMLVAMGWFFIVPGPWAHQHPLAGGFQTGGDPAHVVVVAGPVSHGGAHDVEPLAKMPTQGSWLMKVKKALSFLRPVLHVLLFVVPAFVIALLCGARCAWWCGLLTSCSVELGQIGFGYGFDWVDVCDLVVNAMGVAVAVWVAGRSGWLRRLGGAGEEGRSVA